ncbi:MAG: acyl-ACP--UDP-N-acetylglucosamine O-acyltransferase [Phycisphaerae bacterium]|nr:acyl-ACP--UDP-N-acetylglucosamine O-acyltransferase [Phycisphaerae bacterium]
MANIHPTAVVDHSAQLADDVEVGPYAIIEGDVEIGPGTVIRPHAVIRRYTSMGAGNHVDSFVALGGEPQDYKFDVSQVSYLRIGDKNIFREGVTISRGTGEGSETRVGDGTYWMANSHAGHNCIIEDGVILANGALVAGHCTVGRKAILPANGCVHQFVWIGEMCMFQGGAAISMHAPPFCLLAEDNTIVGLNVVGLRRSPDITDDDREDVKEVFQLLYRSGLTPTRALEEMDKRDLGSAGSRFREFVRKACTAQKPYHRGIVPNINRGHQRKQ